MRATALTMLAILMSAAASPASAQQVSVADGDDWNNIPLVKAEGKTLVNERVIDDISAAAQKQSCAAVGANPRRIEMSVPFLIHFNNGGSVEQIVVRRIGCPQIESLIGGSLAQMAKEGEYRPTMENDAGWYRGSFDISTREGSGLKSETGIICKLVTPSGSRFPKRLCGTQKQWDEMRRRSASGARAIIDSDGDKVD